MAAPTFVDTSTGNTDAASPGVASTSGFSASVGDVFILQVLQDGTTAGITADFSGIGWENLAGTDGQATFIGTFDVGSPATALQHLWIGRVTNLDAAGNDVGLSGYGSEDIYCRIYSFFGVSTGTTLADVIENGTAGSTVNSAGTSATIADADVTTLGADRLALNFVAGNDDNAIDAFTGMTGGTWAEAVAEYAEASGTDGVIQLQTATIASAGTIGGGTDGWADAADSWGVVGFALKPQAGAVVTFAASVSGTGAVTPNFVREQRVFASSIAGTGALSTNFVRVRNIEVAIAGSGAAAVTRLNRERPLTVSISGVGTIVADLVRVKLMEAMIAGLGAVSSSFVRTRNIVSSISGTGAVTANTVNQIVLAATISGLGAVATSRLDRTRPLNAVISGTGAIASVFVRSPGVATSISGVGQVAADFVKQKNLDSAIAGTGQVVALVADTRVLAVVIAGEAQVLPSLAVIGSGPQIPRRRKTMGLGL